MFYDDKEFIAKIVKKYRAKKKLTQAELAEKVGVNDQHISKLENGTYMPSLKTFFSIVDVLEIDLDDFGIKNFPSSNPKKDDLIKLVHSFNDNEIDFYLDLIQQIKKNSYLL